jgi:hypothetical protein
MWILAFQSLCLVLIRLEKLMVAVRWKKQRLGIDLLVRNLSRVRQGEAETTFSPPSFYHRREPLQ